MANWLVCNDHYDLVSSLSLVRSSMLYSKYWNITVGYKHSKVRGGQSKSGKVMVHSEISSESRISQTWSDVYRSTAKGNWIKWLIAIITILRKMYMHLYCGLNCCLLVANQLTNNCTKKRVSCTRYLLFAIWIQELTPWVKIVSFIIYI